MESNPVHPKPHANKDRVVIFDTTLRDGEQCPGATMTFDEKLEVAEVLDEMGVDIIEAGFPIASQGDFDSVQEIARRAKKAVICGLARAQMKDIETCAEAIKPAARGRIHTFIGTSPLHRKYQMAIDEAEVLDRITPVRHARAVLYRRCRMVGHGRDPHRARFPLPLRGGRDQGGRHHGQYPGHRRLCHA